MPLYFIFRLLLTTTTTTTTTSTTTTTTTTKCRTIKTTLEICDHSKIWRRKLVKYIIDICHKIFRDGLLYFAKYLAKYNNLLKTTIVTQ